MRFYKGAGNTGVHTGSLWTSSGALLSTGTFTSETASGWQQMLFPAPVAVSAGTTYVASYHAPNGHYAADSNYFATALTNGPLQAPRQHQRRLPVRRRRLPVEHLRGHQLLGRRGVQRHPAARPGAAGGQLGVAR